ncbi:MAG TPA: hypothetical protein VL172_17085, partial [Kofleriaceae bacterium]|nr:hypothetical protein [Kofleriaceae bacterium]
MNAFRGLAIVSVLVGAAGMARANVAAPPPAARMAGLGIGDKTPLVVVSGDLLFDCSGGTSSCSLQVTYEVKNPSTETAGGTAAFYSMYTTEVTIEVDGKPVSTTLTEQVIGALDEAVKKVAGERWEYLWARAAYDYGTLGRHGFTLSLAPGASARVVVRGHIAPRRNRAYYMALPAGRARHLLLAHDPEPSSRVTIDYLVTPIRTWGGFPAEMTYTIKAPRRWSVYSSQTSGVTDTQESGLHVQRGRVATTVDNLSLDLYVPARLAFYPGVLLGFGGHVDNATGKRVRAGVELGIGDGWLTSLTGEWETAGDGIVVV